MTNGIDAGNVFLQAEQIKGLRSKSQANLLAQQRGAQFRPLLAQALANPQDPNLRNQLIALDPQAAQQAFGAQTAATGAQQAQFDLSEDRAARGVSLAEAVIKSKAPKALLMNVDPELVSELEEQGVDIEAMTDAEAVRFATDVRDQFLPRTSQEFQSKRATTAGTEQKSALALLKAREDLNKTDFDQTKKIVDDTIKDERVDNFIKTTTAFDRIQAAEDTAAGDISLIFAFMKMNDPGSTVREGEFATAQNATGVPGRVVAAYNRALQGTRLTPTLRADFKKTAGNILKKSKATAERVVKVSENRLKRFDLRSETVREAVFGLPEDQADQLPAGVTDNGDGTFTLPDGRIVRRTGG